MLLNFTEKMTGNPICINPDSIIAVFTAVEGDYQGTTVISVTNGSIFVAEELTAVIGTINGALK